jgi:DNA-binding response OmpR family regulator
MPVIQHEIASDCFDSRQVQLVNHEKLRTQGHKILIVDDDRDVCLGLHVRLKANYYDTCFAHDASSAISTALYELPDLIILDIGLPGDDGYTVLQRMHAFPELEGIPVVIVTGRDRFTHEKISRGAGASRFFEKPIDNRRLLSSIRELLD